MIKFKSRKIGQGAPAIQPARWSLPPRVSSTAVSHHLWVNGTLLRASQCQEIRSRQAYPLWVQGLVLLHIGWILHGLGAIPRGYRNPRNGWTRKLKEGWWWGCSVEYRAILMLFSRIASSSLLRCVGRRFKEGTSRSTSLTPSACTIGKWMESIGSIRTSGFIESTADPRSGGGRSLSTLSMQRCRMRGSWTEPLRLPALSL